MERHELVLAALAAGGENASYSPVQVQKLFFLIDREASRFVGGPHFNFRPYDYGPFDSAVYSSIDNLREHGLTEVIPSGHYRRYSLTPAGQARGIEALNKTDEQFRLYVQQLASWVRSLSFNQLVASIYNKYPDMKVNSVFEE